MGLSLTYLQIRDYSVIRSISDLGFGAVDGHNAIVSWAIENTGPAAVWENIIIANLAQPLISALYFVYNGSLTAIILGTEWDKYGQVRKGLRISRVPEGAQRGTHFLQLPFRYAIPLAATSTVLHWLASQSFFAIIIDMKNGQSFFTCGYSFLPIACLITTLLLMLAYAAYMAFSRFKHGAPVVGSCSAAISAACHPFASEENLSELSKMPLRWGVVEQSADGRSVHCAFSSKNVEFPEASMDYEHWKKITRDAFLEKGLIRRLSDHELGGMERSIRRRLANHELESMKQGLLRRLAIHEHEYERMQMETGGPSSLHVLMEHGIINGWKVGNGGIHDEEIRREIRSRVMYNAWADTDYRAIVESFCEEAKDDIPSASHGEAQG